MIKFLRASAATWATIQGSTTALEQGQPAFILPAAGAQSVENPFDLLACGLKIGHNDGYTFGQSRFIKARRLVQSSTDSPDDLDKAGTYNVHHVIHPADTTTYPDGILLGLVESIPFITWSPTLTPGGVQGVPEEAVLQLAWGDPIGSTDDSPRQCMLYRYGYWADESGTTWTWTHWKKVNDTDLGV